MHRSECDLQALYYSSMVDSTIAGMAAGGPDETNIAEKMALDLNRPWMLFKGRRQFIGIRERDMEEEEILG